MIAIMFEWWLLVLWYLLWVALLALLVTRSIKRHWHIRSARQRGLYPPPDREPTNEDVQRLAAAGEEDLAVYLYEEMHDVGEKEAVEAVSRILRAGSGSDSSGEELPAK